MFYFKVLTKKDTDARCRGVNSLHTKKGKRNKITIVRKEKAQASSRAC